MATEERSEGIPITTNPTEEDITGGPNLIVGNPDFPTAESFANATDGATLVAGNLPTALTAAFTAEVRADAAKAKAEAALKAAAEARAEATDKIKGHRLTVIFADSTYTILEQLAQKKGKSKAEVLRDAISLTQYFDDVKSAGGHILVERGSTTREIVIT